MRSNVLRFPMLFAVAVVLGVAACNRSDEEAELDLPIVVEEDGPIALGESGELTEDEIDIVEEEEPEVVTRTVVVRERPAPTPQPEPERVVTPSQPAAPSRPSSIPAGTRIPIATMAQIDSEHQAVGQEWSGRVVRDVVVNGVVVVPSGSILRGVVTSMDEGDRTEGVGSITLTARSVETVAGSRAISAAPVSGGHTYKDKGFPTKETAIGAGSGAVLGGIIGGKKGAAIGGVIGGAGGAAVGQGRDDYEVAIGEGTEFVFVLANPVSL